MADFGLDSTQIDAARSEGYSDAEIADFLAPKVGIDLTAARKEGYSDSEILAYLAPAKAPQPTKEPEPVSGTLKGVGKTVGQQVAKFPGAVVETAGATAEVASLIDKANSQRQLDVFDKIDRGEKIKPQAVGGMGYRVDQDLIWGNKYASLSTEERAEARRLAEGNIKAPPDLLQRTGESVRKTGEKMVHWAEKAVPLSQEEESRTSVQVTKLLTNMVPYVAAAVTTGGAGLVGYGGLEALNRTYSDALKTGASKETAAIAAVENGTAQGLLNAVPAAHAASILQRLPDAAKGKFVQLLTDAAMGSANMLTMTQVSQIAENAVAQKTFDPTRPPEKGVGENMGPAAIAGAILPLGAAAAGRTMSRARPVPEQVAERVLSAETVDQAIAEARNVVEGTPVDVNTLEAGAREFGTVAEQQQAAVNKLFQGLNRGTVEQLSDGAYQYRAGDEAVPLKVWDGSQREDTIPPQLMEAQRDAYEKLGIRVIYLENDAAIPFDGAVDPTQTDTIFLSNNPDRNAAQVGAHEVKHVLEQTTLPDGTNLADLLHQQIEQGITSEGWRYAGDTFGKTAPDRANFPNTPEGQAAHADAVVSHLINELGADVSGEALRFQSFLPKVVDQVQARYGDDAAKGVVQKMLDGIRQAMTRLREFFFRPEEQAEYGVVDNKSQTWLTNLEQVHDTLSRMYAERFGSQMEKEQLALRDMRATAEQARAPVVEAVRPEAMVRPGIPPEPAPTAEPPAAPEAPIVEAPGPRPATETPAAEAPQTFAQRLATGKEAVWADKSVMGAVQRGLPRNEQFATDVARERIMREDAAPLIRRATDEDGIPEDALPEIARLYRQEEGEAVEAAFDRAVDRWVTREEAVFARIEQDVAEYDSLKMMGDTDPVLGEAFARLEEMYTGRKRERPGDEDIPLGDSEASPTPTREGGAREAQQRPAGEEGGGEPGGGRPLAGEADTELGPVFSPRVSGSGRRLDTEPPGPALLDTPEATADQLAARQRARDKEVAEAVMRGRKGGKAGQEGADDLPLFGGERQKTLFSPRVDPRANPDRRYTPEQQRLIERQRGVEREGGVRAWWTETKKDLATKVAAETVDRYAGLRKISPEAYVGARIANSSEGAKVVFLTEGTLRFNGKAYDFKDRNGGARDLFRPLKAEAGDFLMWVAANRAEGLAKEGRENRFSAEDIAAGKTLNRGDLSFDYTLSNGKTTRSREAAYVDGLRKLNDLNNNARDLLVESGMVSRKTADEWMKNQFYVPFFRETPEGGMEFTGPTGTSGMAKQKGPQALKGGSEQVRDLAENLYTNWTNIIDASQKNRSAAKTLADTVAAGAAEKITTKQYDSLSAKEKKQTTWVMENGEKQHYLVHDPLVQKAVSVLDPLYDPLKVLSAARVAKQVLQVGVTRNPLFAVRNVMRDSLQVLATTPQSMNAPNNLAKGMAGGDLKGALDNLARSAAGRDLKQLKLSDDAVSALAGGGLMRIAAFNDTGVEGASKRDILDTPRKLDAVLSKVENVWKAYGEVISKGEEANRLSLYSKLRKEGVEHDVASFSAQDVTDFGLSGANTIVRYIRETVPFTNSRLQGLYKVGRAMAGADRKMFEALGANAAAPDANKTAAVTVLRTAGVLGSLAIATLALDAIYADDKEYQNRDEFDRNNYWFFKVGEARFRIPMPFEVGALARIAANTAEVFFDDKMTADRYFKNVWSMMKDNLGFDFIPQIAAPLEDLRTNTSGTGRPIEPRGLERLRPDDRFTANNTMAARGVSSAINSTLRAVPGLSSVQGPSPIQLDYLTQAYGGWLATTILGVADTTVRSMSSEPARPSKDTWSSVTQGLIATEPRASSRYVEELYSQAKVVEQAFATYRDMMQQGRAAEAKEFFDENKDLIRRHGIVSGVTRLEGDLNRQIRLITNNPNPVVTPEMKQAQIRRLNAMKQDAAQRAVETMRQMR